MIAAEGLSSASAFEMAARPAGLRLLWATAPRQVGWLHEVELGHDGVPRGDARTLPVPALTLGEVTDLSATFLDEQLALAWIEKGANEARAVATFVVGTAPSVLLDLGAAAISAASARGNLALATEAERQRVLVLWRGLQAPCVEPQTGPCVGFTFRRLRSGAAENTGLPLSVPVPCVAHAAQLALSPGRFHYGVCTREGADPVTTMFTIQYEPEYARAEPLLKGCLPLGTVEAAGAPWLVADCHGRRRAVPVPLGDEKVQPESIDALATSCTPERAELRQGRFVVALREPRANLQSVLPSSWLPTGARAGWTGSSLVLAYSTQGRLETRVLACRAGKLAPL